MFFFLLAVISFSSTGSSFFDLLDFDFSCVDVVGASFGWLRRLHRLRWLHRLSLLIIVSEFSVRLVPVPHRWCLVFDYLVSYGQIDILHAGVRICWPNWMRLLVCRTRLLVSPKAIVLQSV